MMTFTVKYKLSGQWFWRTLKRVRGDAVIDGTRVIIMEDETQVHLPLSAAVKFSVERFWKKKRDMERESGQPIQVETAAR